MAVLGFFLYSGLWGVNPDVDCSILKADVKIIHGQEQVVALSIEGDMESISQCQRYSVHSILNALYNKTASVPQLL